MEKQKIIWGIASQEIKEAIISILYNRNIIDIKEMRTLVCWLLLEERLQ
jgi:hypothetical protein